MKNSNVKKGMLVNFLRNSLGDCTNKGVSTMYDQLVLVGEGVPEIFEVDENKPYLEVGVIRFRGEEHKHAKPVYPENSSSKENKHHMFGGNFCYTSDSRFSELFGAPLKVHDRVEF